MISYANRGSTLEELIMWANRQYEDRGVAKVNKVPVPIKILNIARNIITKAYIEEKSTVDYIGVIQGGKFICFDCKETREKSFPLKNVHEHQIRYMDRIHGLGGHAFLIVNFVEYQKYYRLSYPVLRDYWTAWKKNSRKRGYASIPFIEFERQEVSSGKGLALDYLFGLVA